MSPPHVINLNSFKNQNYYLRVTEKRDGSSIISIKIKYFIHNCLNRKKEFTKEIIKPKF